MGEIAASDPAGRHLQAGEGTPGELAERGWLAAK